MMVIPFQTSAVSYNIFVVLQDGNLSRIRQYDPAQIEPRKMGRNWDKLKLDVVLIGYATEQEIKEIGACNDSKAVQSMLKKLSRGFAFRPDMGDHDGAYRKGRG